MDLVDFWKHLWVTLIHTSETRAYPECAVKDISRLLFITRTNYHSCNTRYKGNITEEQRNSMQT